MDNRAAADYILHQSDTDASMRCTVVEQLIDVAEEFRFQRQTLFVSVNVTDRF